MQDKRIYTHAQLKEQIATAFERGKLAAEMRATGQHGDSHVATLRAALRQVMAALDQPVQNSDNREPATCDILRGDAAHAWEFARSALAATEPGQ